MKRTFRLRKQSRNDAVDFEEELTARTSPLGDHMLICEGAKRSRAATGVVAALDGWLSGDVLLSHPLPRAVPLALAGLASGFGMGPGVSLPLWSP